MPMPLCAKRGVFSVRHTAKSVRSDLTNLEDARQVTDYLLQTGAEPAIWEPWLLLDYLPMVQSCRFF